MIKRLWLDFRNGHSIYLVFGLSIINFILIGHNFFISKFFKLNLAEFVIIFACVYIPVALILGYLYRTKQYNTDNTAYFENNKILAKLYLLQIKMFEGTATKQDIESMKNYLARIARE